MVNHEKSKLNAKNEEPFIIEAAAKLIYNDIKTTEFYDRSFYPSLSELNSENELISSSLNLFMKTFFKDENDVKLHAIMHAIIQNIRTVIAPLQIGLAVQMYHHFKSRYLVDALHSLGFCSSYSEVLNFIRNASIQSGSELNGVITDDSAVSFICDNVDHNLRTLNGENIFHGMGIIAAVKRGNFSEEHIPRRKVTNEEILKNASIEVIVFSHVEKQNLSKIELQKLYPTCDKKSLIDFMWRFSVKIPSWSGLMQIVYDDKSICYETDRIFFLPIIDLSPSDMTCIYSTLRYVSNLAFTYKIPCIITFDQPLFWKSSKIINETTDPEFDKITLLLGTFHIAVNLLGCIGEIMNNSGFENILEEIYGGNAVQHMLQGKAFSRALRGNLIVVQALSSLLYEKAFLEEVNLSTLSNLYENLVNKTYSCNEIENNTYLIDMQENIELITRKMIEETKTSKLWIGYIKIVSMIQNLIKAVRLCSVIPYIYLQFKNHYQYLLPLVILII